MATPVSRDKARAILGRQPRGMLKGMAIALQLHPWHNSKADWQRLAALKALGYKVKLPLP